MLGHSKEAMFPSRVAKGLSFCNRSEEKKRIQNNCSHVQHTLIISPRRYGKTSLALEALSESKLPFASIQFFNAFRNEIVLERFVAGLNDLLYQLMPKTKQAFAKFTALIRHATLSLTMSGFNLKLSLKPLSQNPVDIIKGLLQDIDHILKQKNRRAVLFFDEFQDIVQSDISDELQATLRDFAQHTDHLTFIISGSHRHLLKKLFDDSNKPFYKLFDRIDLKRIKKEHYILFIQKQARRKWKNTLPEEVINEILTLTECHAYYLNRLCSKLWEREKAPSLKTLVETWKELVEEEFPSIANDLSALTKNQRIVLQAMSSYSALKEPHGSEFLQKVALTPRSVSLALDALEKTDHIERTPLGYNVIDPITKHILTRPFMSG